MIRSRLETDSKTPPETWGKMSGQKIWFPISVIIRLIAFRLLSIPFGRRLPIYLLLTALCVIAVRMNLVICFIACVEDILRLNHTLVLLLAISIRPSPPASTRQTE